jgi:urate oxidase
VEEGLGDCVWESGSSVPLARSTTHTFISRLAENPNVSEETLKALAGHVSKRMLERYSHIRTKAKRAAIAALEQASITTLEDSSQIADRTAFAAFPEEV